MIRHPTAFKAQVRKRLPWAEPGGVRRVAKKSSESRLGKHGPIGAVKVSRVAVALRRRCLCYTSRAATDKGIWGDMPLS